MTSLLFVKIITSPKFVALFAALWIGRPDIADDLQSICKRESKCSFIREHEIDAWISPHEWHGQKDLGHLNPECQKKNVDGGWATRGSWGLSAGAHWKYLPKCYQPSVLDIPHISAIIAAKKYVKNCWAQKNYTGWCKVSKNVRKNNKKIKKELKIKYKRPQNWNEFLTQSFIVGNPYTSDWRGSLGLTVTENG